MTTSNSHERRKSLIRNIIGGVVAVGILAGVIGYANKGDVVYRGIINGRKADYTENQGSLLFGGEKNELRYINNGIEYKLIDSEDRTSINWFSNKSDALTTDTLETIKVKTNKVAEKFRITEIGDETLNGKNTEEIFQNGNTLYNNTRRKIREKLRAEYNQEIEKIIQGLK